jgi:alpha-beta hydrolase superfamily lysophospholipase
MGGWRIALLLGLFAGLLFAVSRYGGLPDEPRAQSASSRLLQSGIYAVGDIDYHLVDTSRPTAANGDFPGLDHRELDIRVWFPQVENGRVAPGRHPLLVYSHGFAANKLSGAYLANYMARQGYLVVAADYPLTRFCAPGGSRLADVVNQPGDISFLLDTLLAWDSDPDSPFFERLDPARIAAMGISLGGLTSALTVYHPRWRDDRLRLVVSIAGPSSMLGPGFFHSSEVPMLVVATPGDALVDYQANAAPLLYKAPNVTLVTLADGSHSGFSGLSRYTRWLDNPDSLVCRYVLELLEGQALAQGWEQMLGNREDGIKAVEGADPCAGELSTAINPVLQQRMTILAVSQFLQQHFARTALEIASAKHFLYEVMPEEFSGVTVEHSSKQG